MDIIHFFDGDFVTKLQSHLSDKEGKLFIVLLEYQATGFSRADFEGLNIALDLDTQNEPLIICSFMPETYFLANEIMATKFHGILARTKTAFAQLPDIYEPEEWHNKYLELSGNQRGEDVIAMELYRNNFLQETMGRIRHDYGRYFDDTSEEAKLKISLAIEKAKKAGLTGSEEEIIEQIKNFTPKSNHSLFAGRYFPGIFCDIEGTLFIGESVNEVMLETLIKESATKPITLWTGGDVKNIQEKLLRNNITWKLLSKYDFSGAEVEIAYDDDTPDYMLKMYDIKIRKYRSVRSLNYDLAEKVKFLHLLLTPNGAKEVLSDKSYDKILCQQYAGAELRRSVKSLIAIGRSLDDRYIEILRGIRDFLMKE